MTDVTTVISAVAPALEGEFRIGRVFSRTFTLLRRNFPIYFAVAAGGSVPGLLLQKTHIPLIDDTVALSLALRPMAFILMWVLGLVSQAIILHVAFQDMRGRRVSLTEAMRAAFARILPLVGLAICMGVAIAVGLLLLIAPGLVLLIMWYVATPALIVERLGVFASMDRSITLTEGHRWAIFGTWLLLALANVILATVVVRVVGPTESAGLVTAASAAWSALANSFVMVFVVATYHDLRVAKEGIDTRQVAAVFE